MRNTKIIRQQISELADGELADEKNNETLMAMKTPEQLQTWSLYHQIGDVLRSEQMAAPVSADFYARMNARLEAEPVLLAPKPGLKKRIGLWQGTLAAIAAASAAFMLAPQIISHWMPGQATDPDTLATNLASTSQSAAHDSQFNQYILVHQSSYSSLYGAAQLGRPVSFAAESEK